MTKFFQPELLSALEILWLIVQNIVKPCDILNHCEEEGVYSQYYIRLYSDKKENKQNDCFDFLGGICLTSYILSYGKFNDSFMNLYMGNLSSLLKLKHHWEGFFFELSFLGQQSMKNQRFQHPAQHRATRLRKRT